MSKWRITLNGEDITDRVDAAIRREAVLNEITSGIRSADFRAGTESRPDEPDEAELN